MNFHKLNIQCNLIKKQNITNTPGTPLTTPFNLSSSSPKKATYSLILKTID